MKTGIFKGRNLKIGFASLLLHLIFLLHNAPAISIHDGFPVTESEIENGVYHAVTNFDYDQDTRVEIIVGTGFDEVNGHLYVVNTDGNIEMEYEYEIGPGEEIAAPAAVADIDRDHQFEIVFVARTELHVVNYDGTPQSGFPMSLPIAIFDANRTAPVIYDVDGDGYQEIIVLSYG